MDHLDRKSVELPAKNIRLVQQWVPRGLWEDGIPLPLGPPLYRLEKQLPDSTPLFLSTRGGK